MPITKLTRSKTIPFLDTSKTINTTWLPTWKRINYSQVFALNPNPQTVSVNYISSDSPIEEIEKYQPELPQDCTLYKGDPAFDFVYEMFKALPVGADAKVPVLICFAGTTDKDAWQSKDATIVLGELNTVEGKISFTLKLGGTINHGTYVITDGTPVFTVTP